MAGKFEDLTKRVENTTDVKASVSMLIGGITEELRKASQQPQEQQQSADQRMQTLAEELSQNSSEMADAVTANTTAQSGGEKSEGQ